MGKYVKEQRKEYREKNRERIREYMREYREKNREKFREYSKKHSEKNTGKKRERKEYYKEYNEKNKEKRREWHKKNYEKNKETYKIKNKTNYRKEYHKEYYKKNKERINDRNNSYYENNKQKVKIRQSKYLTKIRNNEDLLSEYYKRYNMWKKMKEAKDPVFKLKRRIQSLISRRITKKGYNKTSRTCEILGLDYESFKLYIESQFEPWMNWDNYGKYKKDTYNYGWDIDHIIPTSVAKTEEEVIKLNHHTNLRPLCSKINRDIKKDNYL